MPRIEVPRIIDDHDGKELPAETPVTKIAYGGQRYNLYLSDKNQEKLFDFLATFTKEAEAEKDRPASSSASSSTSTATSAAEKERNSKVRHWAIDTKFKYKNAKGEEVTLGDRGRIPDVVVKAWEEAGSPDIS